MHLTKALITLATVLGLAATPALAIAADPTGTWQSTTGESRYRVSYCGKGHQLCAKLTWLRPDARTSENLAYLNDYVVTGAVPIDENEWQGEVRYNGDTYVGSVTMLGSDSLKLSGCKGIFCKTIQFTRL